MHPYSSRGPGAGTTSWRFEASIWFVCGSEIPGSSVRRCFRLIFSASARTCRQRSFAGGFGTQHRQPGISLSWSHSIGFEIWEEEVGLVVVFCYCAPNMPDIMRPENGGKVVFQRMPHAGLTPGSGHLGKS